MNKQIIEELLKTSKSLKTIAEELNTSQTNLRYWIKKYEIVRDNKEYKNNFGNCLHCNKESFKTYCDNKCKSLYSYYKNKKERDDKSTIHVKKVRESFKLEAIMYGGNRCKYCSYNKNYSALSFHHTNPKEKDFPLAGQRGVVLTPIHKKELDKCILLCANCHMNLHHNLREQEKNVRSKQSLKGEKVRRMLIQKLGNCCQRCNITGVNDIFAFHHKVESEKEFKIDARTCNGYSYERLEKEVLKCELLCHNCHTEEHHPNNLLKDCLYLV